MSACLEAGITSKNFFLVLLEVSSIQTVFERGTRNRTSRTFRAMQTISADARAPKRACPSDIKVLCRLIALHHKLPTRGAVFTFCIDGRSYAFRVKCNVHLRQNVRVLVFERALDSAAIPLPDADVIFAFNWYSPATMWDNVTLGLKLLLSRDAIEREHGMCNAFFFSLAKDFLKDVEICKILEDIRSREEYVAATGAAAHEMPGITVTGFSMGGAIAHAFSVLLREAVHIKHAPIRCVGFGSPRPGNAALTAWCSAHLTSNSMNIILARSNADQQEDEKGDSICAPLVYDPVTCSPSTARGFDVHPKAHLLVQQPGGILLPLPKEEQNRLRAYDADTAHDGGLFRRRILGTETEHISASSPVTGDSAQTLHSALNYYKAMYRT